jgi:transposase, IS5 family
MVALHYLKYQHDLSDEDVVGLWVENPYWQHFSGMTHFQHRMPIDPSSMTRWRKRLGDAGAEQMLRATIEAGMKMRAIQLLQIYLKQLPLWLLRLAFRLHRFSPASKAFSMPLRKF